MGSGGATGAGGGGWERAVEVGSRREKAGEEDI